MYIYTQYSLLSTKLRNSCKGIFISTSYLFVTFKYNLSRYLSIYEGLIQRTAWTFLYFICDSRVWTFSNSTYYIGTSMKFHVFFRLFVFLFNLSLFTLLWQIQCLFINIVLNESFIISYLQNLVEMFMFLNKLYQIVERDEIWLVWTENREYSGQLWIL